jgi:hypothetical protein
MLDYSNENFLEEKQNKLSIAMKLRSWFEELLSATDLFSSSFTVTKDNI